MADEQLQREKAQLREAIERVASEQLKAHMLQALSSFDADVSASSTPQPSAAPARQQQQRESDRDDPVTVALRGKRVAVKTARDALFLAVHGLILESAGFQLVSGSSSEFAVPAEWDANSSSGLFTASYRHPNDLSIKFELQGLFVGNKFEVYISDDKDHSHSLELSADAYVASSGSTSTEPTLAADLLQDVDALRQKVTPFIANIVPKKERRAETCACWWIESCSTTASGTGSRDRW
jgi:hypothetical protein